MMNLNNKNERKIAINIKNAIKTGEKAMKNTTPKIIAKNLIIEIILNFCILSKKFHN